MVLVASTAMDALPNIGMNMDVVSVPSTTADTDWVEMSTYGYTTVYLAIVLGGGNAVSTCTITDNTKVTLSGGAAIAGAAKILVIGV